MTYLNGEIVRIVIHEAEVIEVLDDGDGNPSVRVQLVDDRGEFHVEIPIGEPVRVIRVRPSAGMPQPGDIWRDGFGTEYFAKQDGPAGSEARLVHAGYSSQLWESVETVNRERGPLTLVYRPSAEPGEPS